jgi:peroxiredoxin
MKSISLLALLLWVYQAQAEVSPFELPWMNQTNAKTYSSESHKGGIFVVETYFLNCPYCNDNAPSVDALATKFAEESRVQVLDVGIDKSDAQYQTWIERHHPNHPVLKDAKKELISQLGTSVYPSTYVLDCEGNVVYQSQGTWDSEKIDKIEQTIRWLLNSSCGIKPDGD